MTEALGAGITESAFREKSRRIFERIDHAFGDVDPDLAECEWSQGALVVQFADGTRAVLSVQPAVRQIWLALGGKGTAYHFQWDSTLDAWVDPTRGGVELLSSFTNHVRQLTGLPFEVKHGQN